MHRRFELVRTEDVSGVSGCGVVAEGICFSDNKVTIRWCVGEHPSTVVWDDMESVEHVHGHEGRTTVRWIDE